MSKTLTGFICFDNALRSLFIFSETIFFIKPYSIKRRSYEKITAAEQTGTAIEASARDLLQYSRGEREPRLNNRWPARREPPPNLIYTGKREIIFMDNLFILSNSPGEIAGWVKPTAEAFAKKNRGARVTLAVLPCPYASGMERRYGGEIGGIDHSLAYRDVWKGRPGGGRNLVLQLGGDPMFGALLSAKFRMGWMIYTSRPKWRGRVTHYFIPDACAEGRFTAAGVKKERFTRTGNLALDSVPRHLSAGEAKTALGLSSDVEVISFLPGSRPFEYRQGAAFFCRAAQEVLEAFPGMLALMPIAPTVDEDILRKGLTQYGLSWDGGERAETVFCGQSRIRLVRGDVFSAIKASRLVVALPGTNNLQTAALGVPLLMVAPLNEAENIPLDGIPGIIPPSFPGFKYLKRRLVFHFNRREKFVSLPNRLTGKAIVPEYRGLLTPRLVAGLAKELLASPGRLEKISGGYGEINFEFGAAEKIAERVSLYFAR